MSPIVLLGCTLTLAVLWWVSRGSPVRYVACASTFIVAGALANECRRPGPAPELDAEPSEVLLLSGCIVEPVTSGDATLRFVLELTPGARVRTTLTAEKLPVLRYGQQIEIQARVRKPRNFANPGAFDYAGWLARQKIFWTATARGTDTLRVLPGRCGSPLQRWALQVREVVVQRIRELYPAGSYEARVLPALLVGEAGISDRDWTEGYRRTGTYHALVVSGLHIAVVAGGLLFLLRFAGLPLGIVLSLAATVAWSYAAIVNWQPPATRSAAGFTLFLVARWFFRRGRVLNLLAAVVLGILAIDPASIYDASLQLTVLSVAAIGGLAAPVSERWINPYGRALRSLGEPGLDQKHPHRAAQFRIELRLVGETAALCSRTPVRVWTGVITGLGRIVFWVGESAVVSGCIQLALAVPLALYFHTFSATAIGANAIVAPALSLAVPVGLLACFTGFPPFAVATSALIGFARSSTDVFATVEPSLRLPDPPAWLALTSLLATASLAYALIRCRRWWPLAGLAAASACALIWSAPFPSDLHPGELELTVIDVGQGDSLLLASPDGRTLLVDAGGIPAYNARARSALDPGEDVVSPYLWRRGLKRLDVVAVSHLHEDHAGGLPAVIRNFRPAELWTGATPDSASWTAIRAAAREAGTRIRMLTAGAHPDLGSAQVTVLAPLPGYVAGEAPDNRDSLVLQVRYGRHSLLLTGDADQITELGLDVSEVDILKVAHHGSRGSTSAHFLERVRPLFAAISAGADNSYGHPHPDLLRRLRGSGTRHFRTDRNGLITFRTDGRRIVIEEPLGLAR
jgi:competence protein ComEC